MKLFLDCYRTALTQAEAEIAAKYDLLIVNQDTRPSAVSWLNVIRGIKPSIKLLAYLIVTEEPGAAPGAGNTILMDRNRWDAAQQEPWLMTPAGDIAAITVANWKRKRLFDFRLPVWQQSFKDACAAILSAYPFDGLFLDNCTASWAKHAAGNPGLSQSLQSVLLDVRRSYPDKILVGNGVENWMGLNGEMNEGRIGQIGELVPSVGQVVPNMNLYYMVGNASTTDAEITAVYQQVKQLDGWLGLHRTDAAIHWPAIFDTLEVA